MVHHANLRANVRQSIQLQADLENATASECPAVILDLSNSGVRLVTNGHIDAGERVAVTLHLTGAAPASLRAVGTAVRICALEPDRRWGRMLAVEFDAPLSDSAGLSAGCLDPEALD